MTGQSGRPAGSTVSYVRPTYTPASDGVIRVYAGDLLVTDDGATHQINGDLAFRLDPRPAFYVHLAGDHQWLAGLMKGGRQPVVTLPPGARLEPATASAVGVRTDSVSRWVDLPVQISSMTAGNLAAVERLIIHLNGRVTEHPFPQCDTDEGEQGQLAFTLPDWNLRLAAADEWKEGEEFPFIIEAVPQNLPITADSVEKLQRRLFVLLSFIVGREVGLALTAGLDNANQVVWATWSTPRTGTGQWRWCPDHLVNDALPDLAQGCSLLAADPTMEKVVDRAINLHLVANGTQPVDARIPVACSGLELLAWAVLQSRQWVTTDALSKLSAAASLRLLLQWAGIPVELPSTFTAMEARRRALGQTDLAAPDVLAKIRNDLVHPPKRLAQLQWPTAEEMDQAWRLSMDYLELVILRLLDYNKQYFPHLQLTTRWVTNTDTVPWAR